MKITNKQLDLLINIYKHLSAEGSRMDLANALLSLIEDCTEQREKTRERRNRK